MVIFVAFLNTDLITGSSIAWSEVVTQRSARLNDYMYVEVLTDPGPHT